MTPLSVRSKLLGLVLDEKAGHVRDTEYWQMPFGTPIVPGMKPGGKITPPSKPKKPTKVQKPKPPKHNATAKRAQSMDESFGAIETQGTPVKAKIHPPYPPYNEDMGMSEKLYGVRKDIYERRTSIPPRNSGDYEAMTTQEMWDDWAPDRERWTADAVNPLPKNRAVVKAIRGYTGSEYEYMNGLPRRDLLATADLSSTETLETARDVHKMDKAMREVGKNIVVYRTTRASAIGELGVGAQFRDNGYTSTTILEGYLDEVKNDLYNATSSDQYTMDIRVPANAKALYVTAFQQNRDANVNIGEAELVMARGTEYRVVEKNGNHLVLEVITPDDDRATPYEDTMDEWMEELVSQKLDEEADEEDW